MPIVAPAVCRACNKDITQGKRVKSPQGHIFCEGCVTAAQRKATGGERADGAGTVPPAIDAGVAAKKLPAFCPNCEAPVLTNRRICVKCHRDMTKMDAIIARKIRDSKLSMEEKVGNWLGRAMRMGLVCFVVGVVGLMGYGGWLMMHPPGPFDDFPTTRIQAVRQILGDIAQGTDKGYASAFQIISMPIRNTNNVNEPLRYKMVYTHMHDDFLSKYGADWPSKAKIEAEFGESSAQIVPFVVTLNQDEYHVKTQAQMSVASSIEQVMMRDQFAEDGKQHFGVMDIEEYTLIPKTKEQVALEEFVRAMRHRKQGK